MKGEYVMKCTIEIDMKQSKADGDLNELSDILDDISLYLSKPFLPHIQQPDTITLMDEDCVKVGILKLEWK